MYLVLLTVTLLYLTVIYMLSVIECTAPVFSVKGGDIYTQEVVKGHICSFVGIMMFKLASCIQPRSPSPSLYCGRLVLSGRLFLFCFSHKRW